MAIWNAEGHIKNCKYCASDTFRTELKLQNALFVVYH